MTPTPTSSTENDGACPIIRAYVTHLKSFLPPADLNLLYMREPAVRKSKAPKKTETARAKQLVEHVVLHCLPEGFSMFGLAEGTGQLRELPNLRTPADLEKYCDTLRRLSDKKWDSSQSGVTLLRDAVLAPLRDTEKAVHLLKQDEVASIGKLLSPTIERLGRSDAFIPVLDAMLAQGSPASKMTTQEPVSAAIARAKELQWVEPADAAKLTDLRRDLFPLLAAAVIHSLASPNVLDIPKSEAKALERQVRAGIRRGLKELTMSFRTEQLEMRLRMSLNAVPSYWEPPQAEDEPSWPAHQLQAYRWAACGLAWAIRNELEDLHAKHISNDSMPRVNRSIRNAVYQILMLNPALAWRLTDYPRVFLQMHASGIPGVQLPPAVGAA